MKTNIIKKVLLLPALIFAQPINFNNNCDGQVPTNAGGTWSGTCPDPTYGETNWEGNVWPDSTDDAVIDAQYGPIPIASPIATSQEAFVASVQAPGGLIVNGSTVGLHMYSGTSNITGLVLSNNGTLSARTGVQVNLSGSTTLGGHVNGPGIFTTTGTLSLDFAKLHTAATVEATGTSTFTTGTLTMDSATTLSVPDVLTVTASGGGLQGGNATINNSGIININTSSSVTISTRYIQTGSLVIQGGTLIMDSPFAHFQGGSVTVQDGNILEHSGPVGANRYHLYDGISSLGGNGLVDVYEPFETRQGLTFGVGTGDPATGAGGYRLQSTLVIPGGVTVTNNGRFRMNDGTLTDTGSFAPIFINSASGWFYTRATGRATIDDVSFDNFGSIELGGGGLAIEGYHGISNSGLFRIVASSVSGEGYIYNNMEIHMAATDTSARSQISCKFYNRDAGTVRATSGHLLFPVDTSFLNLFSDSILAGGSWIASLPGTITFPNTIKVVDSGSVIQGPAAAFPNVDLSNIQGGSRVTTDEWSAIGDLLVDSAELKVQAGGTGFTTGGTLENANGGEIQIDPGAELQADQIDNGDPDEIESVVSELQGIVVLAKRTAGPLGRSPPSTITTRLFNNRARLVPGGHRLAGEFEIVGEFVQYPTGIINIELDTALAGDGFDLITINGNATLAGTVNAEALPAFTPVVGQQFPFLTTTGTITGAFDTVYSTDGNTYRLIHNANSVVLEVASVGGTSVIEPLFANAKATDGLSMTGSLPYPGNSQARLILRGSPETLVDISVSDMAGRIIVNDVVQLDGAGFGVFGSSVHMSNGVYHIVISSEGQQITRTVTLVQ